MSALLRRFNGCCHLRSRSINVTVSFRYFKTKGIDDESNQSTESTATSITKSIKSKWSQQKEEQTKSFYKREKLKKIQSPSGYQPVKRQIRNCKNLDEVMEIMSQYKKCEDVQLGTTAITTIYSLLYDEQKKISNETAMKHIDQIWNMMREYAVGMDCAAYTEYFVACNILQFGGKCHNKFYQMLEDKVTADYILLNALLKSCCHTGRRGRTKHALQYWKTVVIDMQQVVPANTWGNFIAVCAKAKDVKLAEKCFQECPYKQNIVVCSKLMSVYKNVGNLEKVLEMYEFMKKENIEIDAPIYNTIANAYRVVEQWQNAICIVEQAISMNNWNAITIHHLFEAKIGMIKMTDNYQQRKKILEYIELNIVKYFDECKQVNQLEAPRYSFRILDAYASTYKNFGPVTFEECCQKYKIKYWEDVKLPTLNLFTCNNYDVARVILEYAFEKEIDLFKGSGLNIMINNNTNFRGDVVSKDDVNSILSSMHTEMQAEQLEPGLLHISCEQIKFYDATSDDEVLF
eukprot:39574_1